jgi:hypothetical protein
MTGQGQRSRPGRGDQGGSSSGTARNEDIPAGAAWLRGVRARRTVAAELTAICRRLDGDGRREPRLGPASLACATGWTCRATFPRADCDCPQSRAELGLPPRPPAGPPAPIDAPPDPPITRQQRAAIAAALGVAS